MILIYRYDDSVFCDWLAGIILSVYWENLLFQLLCYRIFSRSIWILWVIYMLYTWKSCIQGCLKVKYEACAKVYVTFSCMTMHKNTCEYACWYDYDLFMKKCIYAYESLKYISIKRCGPFTCRQLLGSSLRRQLKLLDSSTLEIVSRLSPSNLEARRSPCRPVLCDNSHELSSLPDQAI